MDAWVSVRRSGAACKASAVREGASLCPRRAAARSPPGRESIGPSMCAVVREAPAPAPPRASRRPVARLWEVDVARTVAIGLMVVYHVAYDVDMLAADVSLDLRTGAWLALQLTCGSLFLLVVGTSFWVAHQRGRAHGLRGVALWRRHARRGVVVLAAAGLVSLATRVALGPDEAIRFGILHLIATAMLVVLPLMVRLGVWNAAIGVGAVALGLVVNDIGSDVPGALVLGFDPGYAGEDWYPLLPWIGASLIGLAIGAVLYPDGERGPWLRRLVRAPRHAALAAAPGRHSLPIYLVHQPVLILLTAIVLAAAGAEVERP
jgi:uncharacterized membrane protein